MVNLKWRKLNAYDSLTRAARLAISFPYGRGLNIGGGVILLKKEENPIVYLIKKMKCIDKRYYFQEVRTFVYIT